MEVFILSHDEKELEDAKSETIGVYSTPEKGLEAYDFYLDNLEATWRKEEEPAACNTFNRFSEVVNDCIAYAKCERDDWHHTVSLVRHQVD